MREPSSSLAHPAASATSPDVAIKRLEWACRRGMKELDLLLVRYLRHSYSSAPESERAAFAQFLELPDPEIARYLVWGDEPRDPVQAALCRRISQPD